MSIRANPKWRQPTREELVKFLDNMLEGSPREQSPQDAETMAELLKPGPIDPEWISKRFEPPGNQ